MSRYRQYLLTNCLIKKRILSFILFISISLMGVAQDEWIKDIKAKWRTANHDTTRVLILTELSNYYKFRRLDSALYYGFEAWSLAKDINFQKGEVKAMQYIAYTYYNLGNDSKALQLCLQGIDLAEKIGFPFGKSFLKIVEGRIFHRSGNYQEALNSYKEAKILIDKNIDQLDVYEHLLSENTLLFMSDTFAEMDQLDSAIFYNQSAYHSAIEKLNVIGNWVIHQSFIGMGNIESRKNNPNNALTYLRHSLIYATDNKNLFDSYYGIGQQFIILLEPDSAIFYTEKSLNYALQSGFYKDIINANLLLSTIHEVENPLKAIQYFKTSNAYNDSLNYLVNTTIQETISIYDLQHRQFEIEAAKKDFQQQLQKNTFFGVISTLIVIAILLFIYSRRDRSAKERIGHAYQQLKSLQAQLIQSEKMASLSQLTAGIAHEIQNPLNFVNNFSEVSNELILEIQEARARRQDASIKIHEPRAESQKSTDGEEFEDEILEDIKQNLEKINHHGKRADSIVKGMLEHSRTGSGVKVLTDINALADEYLRLSYHGMRAKDKNFNVDFKTDFDPNLPKVNVVPQEIGRVLLNIINNAFQACGSAFDIQDSSIEIQNKPQVIVTTKNLGDKIEISIADNGPGIPDAIKDKIFQPFFTTKPTGQGTGLGLSLAYDIVKAHGGEINVETKEGEGSVLSVQLPID